MNLKDLPEQERPKEKLIYYGADQLSNAELLALIIRTGTNDITAIGLAEKVIAYVNREVGSLACAEVSELVGINGIGTAKACSIVAAMELAKRINNESAYKTRFRPKCVSDIAGMLIDEFRHEKQEHVVELIINAKSEIEAKIIISKGDLMSASLNPREVLRPAVKRGAAGIIIAHNHPSGDPEPSEDDFAATRRIMDAAAIMDIRLIDHIVIGRNGYVSFREMGLL